MSERADSDFLGDIKEAVSRTNAYIESLSYEQFLGDKKTQDAVVRNIEVIGEAAKNVSGELRQKYPEIPWGDLAGVRDKLIHHYFETVASLQSFVLSCFSFFTVSSPM